MPSLGSLDFVYLPSRAVADEIANPGPQRIALYELTRPERAAGLAGRRDF
jgi:hypothetical protein